MKMKMVSVRLEHVGGSFGGCVYFGTLIECPDVDGAGGNHCHCFGKRREDELAICKWSSSR